jgi:hypothetical protein
MKKLISFLLNEKRTRETSGRVKKYTLALSIVLIVTLVTIVTVQARGTAPFRFSLVPASNTIATCLPHAAGTVTVLPKEDRLGVDTLDLKTEGLPAQTSF